MKTLSQKGSLLVMVSVFLAIMTLFTVAVGRMVGSRLDFMSRMEDRIELLLIAEAGVRKAGHLLKKKAGRKAGPQSWSLNQSWSRNARAFGKVEVGPRGFFSVRRLKDPSKKDVGRGRYVYGLVDEESKINLNVTQSEAVLTDLFRSAAGLTREDAQALAAALLDWIDPDEDPRDIGAESREYEGLKEPYPPKNGPLGALEELLALKGMTPEIFEKIRPYVTLDGSGKVNLNTAPALVLQALGLDGSLVVKIAAYRAGRDGREGTNDDGTFENPGAWVQTLVEAGYLAPAEAQALGPVEAPLDIGSTHFSVESLARLKNRRQVLKVRAVVNQTGEIKRWQEEYLQGSFSRGSF